MTGSAKTLKNKKAFLEAYRDRQGNISEACRGVNIHRMSYYEWYSKDPDFRRLVDEAFEAIKDWGESQLKKLIEGVPKLNKKGEQIGWHVRPDTAAVIFFNKTINKNRGYVERTEQEAVGGYKIVVQNEEDAELVRQVNKIWEN
jgi:hypothetical protein